MKQITVGVDASPESAAAVRWAAAEAGWRRHPLHLVHLWLLHGRTAQTIPQEEAMLRAAQLLLQDAEADVRTRFPAVRVTNELVTAESPEALWTGAGVAPGPGSASGAATGSEAADGSELLVLGSEGLGTVPGYLLGSVGLHAVAHAACPVVLVRAAEDPARATSGPGPVAVGVSTQPGHEPVLEFAFAAAARYGVPLLAVHSTNRHPAFRGRADLERRSASEADAEQFRAALEPWRSKFPAVHVVEHLSHESPARAVVDVAPGAGLLVVGRGRHNAYGPQVGPVTHAAIHHALCPVATVPHA